MRTSKSEQETIITYNAADERAQIYTCYPPMIRKLDKLAAENPDEWQVLREQGAGKTYTCPKGLITVRSRSRGRRELTDEQKRMAQERMQKINDK